MDAIIELQRQINALSRDVERLHALDTPGAFLPFANYGSLGATGVAVNAYLALASVNRVFTLIYWMQAVFVNTTNDGSNYWTIQLDDGTTAFASFNTSANAAGAWIKTTVSTFTQPSAIPPSGWYGVEIIKTGAPGTLYFAAPVLKVF